MSTTPANAMYSSGGRTVALPSQRRINKVSPQGGASKYNPENNNVIRIGLSPALGFVDTHQSFLSFRILPTGVNFAKEVRLDECCMSWIQKLTIYAGNGSVLEEIDKYNLLNNLLDKTTAPLGYSSSTGLVLCNSGSKAVRQAKACHLSGYQYCGGLDCSGIMSGEMGVLLPMSYINSEITLEITLAPFAECWVGTELSPGSASYQIDNVEYVAHCLTFSE